jgi:hypothetical protein
MAVREKTKRILTTMKIPLSISFILNLLLLIVKSKKVLLIQHHQTLAGFIRAEAIIPGISQKIPSNLSVLLFSWYCPKVAFSVSLARTLQAFPFRRDRRFIPLQNSSSATGYV